MTLIEERLVRRVLDRAITALTEAWGTVRPIEFSLGEMESNPHIVQIVPPNEVVVVIGFEIKMGNRAGSMAIGIPFNAIEPLIEELSEQNWFMAGRNRCNEQWAHHIEDQLSDAFVEIAGRLAETTITMEELQSLEVGDILTTGKSADQPVVMTVGKLPKFFAHIGQSHGKRALKILRSVQQQDRL